MRRMQVKPLLRFSSLALLVVAAFAIGSASVAAQDAASTYKAKCVVCHGADGKGSNMGQKMGTHDFTSADVQKESDAQLTDTIAKGKGKMPAYEGKLKDTEIKDLVAYIRTLAKK
jgi:cytochrome c6